MKYVHLNVKSEYSFLNSILKTKDLVQFASKQDVPAIALTDLNNLFNAWNFQQQAQKAGVHSILGCTFTIRHEELSGNLTVLAKNQQGWHSLVLLSTLANSSGRELPYLTETELQQHAEGLIALTGGIHGLAAQLLELPEQLNEHLRFLKSIFHEDLYFEFGDHELPKERKLLQNETLKTLLDTLQIDHVGTNEVYYLKPEYAFHRSLAVDMNPNPESIPQTSWEVDHSDQWDLKTPEQMEQVFAPYLDRYPNLLLNTVKIAESCTARVADEKALPSFPLPEGYTSSQYLRHLANLGFEERLADKSEAEKAVYRERLDKELSVIEAMGFVDYHLIVSDFIQWAKDDAVYAHPQKYFPENHYDLLSIPEKIRNKDYTILTGPGRGSAAGSLLCYCLKITDIDPIPDHLLFERFLNVERVSMPDIDTDFANYGRYDVIEYCQAKYGFDKVCQIATFQTLGVKGILKSVGKALGLSFDQTNTMSANVPGKITLENGETKPVELLSELQSIDYFQKQIQNDSRIAQLFEVGEVLEGLPSASGKHAAGVIISRNTLTDYVPLMEVDGVLVSQFEKRAVESINLLKMDFLGLTTLDIFHECLRLIEEQTGQALRMEDIPRNDPETFALFARGETGCVFQFESNGMKNLLVRMRPKNLMDLCLANAAYRPGPMQFIDDFIEGRNHPQNVHYPTVQYEAIAKETCGILFYQEQVMQVVQAMAGFSLGEADILRRGIGKKQKEYIEQGKKQFIEGCLNMKTADAKLAKEIYATIEKFANYGFNKSHSDAYGVLAYWCGWLKVHYPLEFMAANCTINADNPDKLSACLREIQRMNIVLLPPDLRYSQAEFTLEQKAIRFSLGAIRSVGKDCARALAKAPTSSKTSLFRLLQAVPTLRRNQVEFMIKAGALDYLGRRKALIEQLKDCSTCIRMIRSAQKQGIRSILEDVQLPLEEDSEYSSIDRIVLEQNAIQISLSEHPLTPYRLLAKETGRIEDLLEQAQEEEQSVHCFAIISRIHEIRTKKGKKMAFVELCDEQSNLEGVVFPALYETLHLEKQQPVRVDGLLSKKEDGVSLIIDKIEPFVNHRCLYVRQSAWTEAVRQRFARSPGILPVIVMDEQNRTMERMPFCIEPKAELFTDIRSKFLIV